MTGTVDAVGIVLNQSEWIFAHEMEAETIAPIRQVLRTAPGIDMKIKRGNDSPDVVAPQAMAIAA